MEKKIRVKIKPSIAELGGGFSDIAGGQEIYPYEAGKLKPDREFEVVKTEFVRRKIETGELIPVCEAGGEPVGSAVKAPDDGTAIKIFVDKELVDEVKPTDVLDEAGLIDVDTLFDRKKVKAALKDKRAEDIELVLGGVRILTNAE